MSVFTKDMARILYESCTDDTLNIPYGITELEEDFLDSKNGADFYNFKRIYIPPTVNVIQHSSVFSESLDLESIDVDENNPYFRSIDGVLFTKNNEVLICYPCNKKGRTYIIPDGTKGLADYAFANSHLEVVFFPKSLIGINIHTFCKSKIAYIVISEENEIFSSIDNVIFSKDKETLVYYPPANTSSEYHIPDGTKNIVFSCFCDCEPTKSNLKKIFLPKSVKNIEESFCFCESIESIEVDKQNETFSSVDGALFTKDYSTLLCLPRGFKGRSYSVPYGVKFIAKYAFNGDLEQIYLPSSFIDFEQSEMYDYKFIRVKYPLNIDKWNIAYESLDGVLFLKSNVLGRPGELIAYPSEKISSSYYVPEGTYSITAFAFIYNNYVNEIHLPKTLKKINIPAFFCCWKLSSINVDEKNKKYSSLEGVLFSKDRKKLIYYPQNKPQKIYDVPKGTECILPFAFKALECLETINLPDSVNKIKLPNFNIYRLMAINVHKNNPCYCSVDGVLYSKNREKLIFYPREKGRKEYIIPKETKQLLDFNIDDYDLKETGFLFNITREVWDSFSNLEAIYVDRNNAYYCSIDGVLFSKDRQMLLYYPENKKQKSFMIPPETQDILYKFLDLEEIDVDKNNPYFCSVDGVLYSKDMKTLIQYPARKMQRTYTVLEGTTHIAAYAFSYQPFLVEIYFPKSIENVDDKAFFECEYLTEVALPMNVAYKEDQEYGPHIVFQNQDIIADDTRYQKSSSKMPKPYLGPKEYIFISYAHKDREEVFRIIEYLQEKGFRIWYDEGIVPGTEWAKNIADHIDHCSYFIAFLSESYIVSGNCKNELTYVQKKEKKWLLIYLDDVSLPSDMELCNIRYQAIEKEKYNDNDFLEKIKSAEGIQRFCDEAQI